MATVSGLFLDYNGPLTNDYLNYQAFSKGISLGTQLYLSPSMNMGINTAYVPQVNHPERANDFDFPSMVDANALVQFKLNNGRVLSENAVIAPYLSTGVGLNSLRNQTAFYIPAAMGIQFRVSSTFSFRLESMYKQSIGQRYQHIAHTVGMVFSVPTKKKEELEIEEEEIEAPLTPMIAEKAVITRPQTGIDTDKDGIPDEEDSCPEVMGLIQFGGCPPVAEEESQQPFGEAVPEVSLEAVERAAPQQIELAQEDAAFLDFAMQNVYFETSSNELKPESYPVLDRIAELMEKYPDAHLNIAGHTDDTGDDKDNLVLSIKRAFQVKYYLVNEKGVRLSRIESDGFGEQEPIADNETENGRSQNRRVEFELTASLQHSR